MHGDGTAIDLVPVDGVTQAVWDASAGRLARDFRWVPPVRVRAPAPRARWCRRSSSSATTSGPPRRRRKPALRSTDQRARRDRAPRTGGFSRSRRNEQRTGHLGATRYRPARASQGGRLRRATPAHRRRGSGRSTATHADATPRTGRSRRAARNPPSTSTGAEDGANPDPQTRRTASSGRVAAAERLLSPIPRIRSSRQRRANSERPHVVDSRADSGVVHDLRGT
jgi:hypothetical protein